MFCNIRSLHQQLDELSQLASENEPDLIGLGETWLTTYMKDEEIAKNGYKLYTRHGGVTLHVREEYVFI